MNGGPGIEASAEISTSGCRTTGESPQNGGPTRLEPNLVCGYTSASPLDSQSSRFHLFPFAATALALGPWAKVTFSNRDWVVDRPADSSSFSFGLLAKGVLAKTVTYRNRA